ncbi:dynein regulatory complex subunit 7-like isoform X4 [Cottoperca gobio]|uniref:Dynein regulatory complex subunit 7-like isoform X4 n=1 Tax=Cottoperca gobio TaxID=56716 RepID=A0A6J2PA33_COTGO|nr:dynein regulatory complex subunit 7-like isoform X4 [Cottoperca gobio]
MLARLFCYVYVQRRPRRRTLDSGNGKFVSMTLRPTPTVFPELLTWGGCASFVANFLSLDPLEPPEGLPRYLFSSSSVLQSQRATCFECATLLCSLLLGAHYDVYCVSGYAVKEMCLLDQSLQECPLLDTEVKSVISEQEPQENKYTVKPLRELKSNFVTQQEKKKQDAEAARFQKHKLQESEQRPADPLQGLRVHCWVLVLSGSRSVQENFFIDPLTGNSYTTDNDNFLGIESVWNNLNYYVNMQDCRNGCAEEEQPRAFEMPRSWVSDIPISKQDLETCWPGTQKVTQYRKAKLEKFAPDLMSDGLITRLTTYKDLNCTDVVMVKEWYQHRNDHLEEREVNEVDSFITESFKRVRRFHLLFHRYTSKSTHTEREMEFSNVGVEDLVRRVESPGEMTEFFEGRKDFLCYRHAVFDTQLSKPDSNINLDDRPVQKVVERFHRNRSKPANEDVAERVFLLAQRRIELTYHLEDHRFIPSKRSFIKPRESTENKKAEDFTQDMVSSFQVDPSEEPLKTLALHEMLVALMKDEDKVLLQIRESKKEVRDIVACREQEEGDIQLHFSPWTTTGAARARSQRQEMERLDAEEQRWLQEKEKDILAPLLIRLDNTETLSAEDAKQLHQDCLAEFKQRLVEHADLIQERYEKETQELQRKQQWYHKKQLNMTEQQEEEYQTYCSEKTLRIHATKKHLNMHKEAAPQKYQTLDWKLKRDPRLAPHLLC